MVKCEPAGVPHFRLEVPVGSQCLIFEHRALDARPASLKSKHFNENPSAGQRVYMEHDHLRPILRFGAAGARAVFELSVADVVGMREQ